MEKLPDDPVAQKAIIEERMHTNGIRIRKMESDISDLQESNRRQDEMLENIHKNTAELVEMWKAGAGAIKVLRVIGKIAVWVACIASAITAVWHVYINGAGGNP